MLQIGTTLTLSNKNLDLLPAQDGKLFRKYNK